MLIDSHTHIDMEQFDDDRNEVLERSRVAGVTEWIVPATTPATALALKKSAWLCSGIHAAVGIHPHYVEDSDQVALDKVQELLESDLDFIAVGETGLDYFYTEDSATKQIQYLERHFQLAEQFELPMILHTRDGKRSAHDDILPMVESSKSVGVLHSFTGNVEEAQRAVNAGWYIGVGGIATFKNSQSLREAIKSVPVEKILVETDAPYLAPIPHRGKRNEPAFVKDTITMLSNLLNLDEAELGRLCTQNARHLFRLTA